MKKSVAERLLDTVEQLTQIVKQQQAEIERLGRRPVQVIPQPYPVYPPYRYPYPWYERPWYQQPYSIRWDWTAGDSTTITTTPAQTGTTWITNPMSTTVGWSNQSPSHD